MSKVIQTSAVELLTGSTDRLTFSLHVPAASASRSGRLSFSAVGLRSYRALGRGETRLEPDVSETVTTLLCEKVPYLSHDVPCTVAARSRDGSPLTLSCRSAAETDISVQPDGTVVCILLPAAGCDTCEIVLADGHRKLLLLRLGFSLAAQTAEGTFDLSASEAQCLHHAVATLPASPSSRKERTTPLSATLTAALAVGVFDCAERAAAGDGNDKRLFPFAKLFSRFPDKPPLRMLKYWMSETCRQLSDLAAKTPEEKGKACFQHTSRVLRRRLAGRFGRVKEVAPDEPFLASVGEGPAFARTYAAYCAFVRAAEGSLSAPAAETALSRTVNARLCLDLSALLPSPLPEPPTRLLPLLPPACEVSSDDGLTTFRTAADPRLPEDALGHARDTAQLAFFLRDAALPPVPETERSPLGPTLEKELAETDWSRFDMLVGSLGSPEQLASNLRLRYYYAPLSSLPRPLPPVRYVAIYQSKRGGDNAGIRYYGEVTDCRIVPRRDIPYPVRHNNPEEPYYLFSVRGWHRLRRPIPVREEGVYAPRFTHPFLFRHALESYELFHVTSERDFRLLMTLRRLSAAPRPQSRGTETASCTVPLGGGFQLLLTGDRLTLTENGQPRVSFALSEFAHRPLYHFERLRRALLDA